jgi:hypothetical protein
MYQIRTLYKQNVDQKNAIELTRTGDKEEDGEARLAGEIPKEPRRHTLAEK